MWIDQKNGRYKCSVCGIQVPSKSGNIFHTCNAATTPPPCSSCNSTASVGKCHICQKSNVEIHNCSKCHHWLCATCRTAWAHRTIAALKEVLGFGRAGCCGPNLPPEKSGGQEDDAMIREPYVQCVHLGIESGMVQGDCPGCPRVQAYRCDVHKKCTVTEKVLGVECCKLCREQMRGWAPAPPTNTG